MDETFEIQVGRTHVLVAVVGLLIAGLLYAGVGGSLPVVSQVVGDGHDHGHDHGDHTHDDPLREQFEVLDAKSTNSCGLQPQRLDVFPDGERLQGSCCSAMNFHSYQEQIEGLNAYSDYEVIPPDPYNVSVEWAVEMIRYAEDTELTEEQQAVYDEATEISHEGGPCCCKCWHWYAYGGLGEKLIVEYDFTAEQVAEIWDLSDACGGDHVHA